MLEPNKATGKKANQTVVAHFIFHIFFLLNFAKGINNNLCITHACSLTRRETKHRASKRETAEGKSPKGIKNNVYLFLSSHFFSIFIEMNMSKWLPLACHEFQNAVLFGIRMHTYRANTWKCISTQMRISFTSPINQDLMLNNMAHYFRIGFAAATAVVISLSLNAFFMKVVAAILADKTLFCNFCFILCLFSESPRFSFDFSDSFLPL